jgi:hypothetical protein
MCHLCLFLEVSGCDDTALGLPIRGWGAATFCAEVNRRRYLWLSNHAFWTAAARHPERCPENQRWKIEAVRRLAAIVWSY